MTARPGRGDNRTTGPTADDGMVTAELAVAIPTVVVVLAAAVTLLLAVAAQLRCTDAAATAARLVARGESVGAATSAARAIAGQHAQVRMTSSAGAVSVDVRVPAGVPLLRTLLHLPAVSADFSQPLEPGVAP
jgi:Flp pilus assembly protein TadG